MSLLTRIAISNGDKNRKDAATKAITARDHYKVTNLNLNLQAEICKKSAGLPSLNKPTLTLPEIYK